MPDKNMGAEIFGSQGDRLDALRRQRAAKAREMRPGARTVVPVGERREEDVVRAAGVAPEKSLLELQEDAAVRGGYAKRAVEARVAERGGPGETPVMKGVETGEDVVEGEFKEIGLERAKGEDGRGDSGGWRRVAEALGFTFATDELFEAWVERMKKGQEGKLERPLTAEDIGKAVATALGQQAKSEKTDETVGAKAREAPAEAAPAAEDERSERQKRDKYGHESWAVVRERLRTGRIEEGGVERSLTAQELAGLRASRRLRVEEAIDMGELDLAAANLTDRIRTQADRSNYPSYIEESAAAMEREALADEEYKSNPWLRGVAGDAVRATRFLAEADLVGRGLTQEEVGTNGVVWDPRLPWRQLIDFETDQQRGERQLREQREHERRLAEEARKAAEAASSQYGGVDYMKKSRLEQAALARAAFLTVEKDGDNIYESIPLVPHGEIYYGLTHQEAETLAARMALSNARARVQQAVKTEQVFPAPELMNISKAALESLSSMPGVSEATAIYAALITRPDLMRHYLGQMGLPTDKRLLDIEEKTKLKKYREAFVQYLGRRFGLDEQAASNAEAVAYNFNKAFKVPESVDHRFYPEYNRSDRTHLSAVVNDTFRTLICPAYKMLDAVERVEETADGRTISTPKDRGKRKGWPRNTLGNFIVRSIDGERGITRVWQKEPLVGNAFCEVEFVDERGQDYKLMSPSGEGGRMGGPLIQAAVDLVAERSNGFHIDWAHAANETPLFNYEFGRIKPAQMLVSTIEELSLPKGATVEQLTKAIGDLGTVGRETRETLYKICWGNERQVPLAADRSEFDFAARGLTGGAVKAGLRHSFNIQHPDFFTLGLPS